MSNYTKSTNFATKDNLSPGDPLKIVRGTEIDTEFNNISTAISTKTDNSAAAITGGSITGITDLAIADGGTGASTATAALNNLLPSQTGNGTKYLQTDGSNATWDAVSLSTSDITGTLPVANGGTGVTSSTGTGNVVLSNSPTLVTPALGTPASGVATNLTGLPISTGVSGLGTGVATFLGTPSSANLASAVSDETGSGALVFANSPTLVTPALGTPASATLTNATGLPISTGVSGLGTGVATFLATPSSANLRSALTDETGTGSAVFATSPALVTPDLGTPSAATLTNATGLPISTGVSGLGTGVATALAVNVGSAGAPVVNGGALGTPSSGTVTNLTGTASININGTVGATTATTGAFTTLAASSSVTLSGGTANGVTYLNGSKVLTSGSALTFDGTNLSTTGSISTSSASGYNVQVSGGNAYRMYTTTNDLVFRSVTAGSDVMTLTYGGNVGIGTSSPSELLTVGAGTASVNSVFYLNGGSDSAKGAGIKLAKAGTAFGYIGAASWMEGGTSNNLAFSATSAATVQMRLDSAGNLGLGVTPSTISTGILFQMPSNAQIVANGSSYLTSNTVFNTAWKYVTTAAASYFAQESGAFKWFNAGSGTAGGTISFTQAMTLDASGNLGVGTTSPVSRITASVSAGGASQTANLITLVNSNDAASNGVRLSWKQVSSANYDTAYIAAVREGANAYSSLVFATSNTSWASADAVERARIDSSGNLLVAKTTSSTVTLGAELRTTGQVTSAMSASTNSTDTLTVYSTGASAYRFYVGLGGTVYATSTTITAISDQRLKENIRDLDEGLATVMALKPRKFDWKEGKGQGIKNARGFIAQEFETVLPDMIEEWRDPAPEGEEAYKAINANLIPTLVKAIQELKTEFDAYKARNP